MTAVLYILSQTATVARDYDKYMHMYLWNVHMQSLVLRTSRIFPMRRGKWGGGGGGGGGGNMAGSRDYTITYVQYLWYFLWCTII